jgi:hypothetical protein
MRIYCSPKISTKEVILNLNRDFQGGIPSSFGGFWGIGGSRLIAKSWDQSGCDLSIKNSSSCSGEDSFSSLRSLL